MARKTRAESSNRAFGYCRVSKEDAVKGESLSVQKSRIEAICAAEGLSLVEIFIEGGVSGGKALKDRPEGAKLLQALRRGDAAVGLKLDRIFRSTIDSLQVASALSARGVKLYVADMGGYLSGTPAAELHLSMMASFATFERRRIGERISEAKASLRAKGAYQGGTPPFGYRLLPSVNGERAMLEPIEEIHMVARDLLSKRYSSRLAAGHFAGLGIHVTHHGVNGLFKQLRDAA